MKNFDKRKKTGMFSRKGYYSALTICLAMVGVACFGSYKQTEKKVTDELSSVAEKTADPVVTKSAFGKEAVDAAKEKKGVKKETLPPLVTTAPVVTEKEEVHSEPSEKKEVSRKFVIPLNGQIIQDFSGDELVKNQTTGAWQTHNGTDIAGNQGDEVKAMSDGTVTDILEDPLWGVVVVIDHGNGITARYCGLNKGLSVSKDDKVSAQDVIGALGNTADIESSMETHLHLEVLRNGDFTDPLDVINNKG